MPDFITVFQPVWSILDNLQKKIFLNKEDLYFYLLRGRKSQEPSSFDKK